MATACFYYNDNHHKKKEQNKTMVNYFVHEFGQEPEEKDGQDGHARHQQTNAVG